MPVISYSDGQVGLQIDDKNKSGFIYYPTGTVAAAIATASDYQNSFYVYDNDKNNSLLLGINENVIGFCSSNPDLVSSSIVFSKTGAIISDANGNITFEWKWDRKSMNAGRAPPEVFVLPLNDYFTLRVRDRLDLFLL